MRASPPTDSNTSFLRHFPRSNKTPPIKTTQYSHRQTARRMATDSFSVAFVSFLTVSPPLLFYQFFIENPIISIGNTIKKVIAILIISMGVPIIFKRKMHALITQNVHYYVYKN